MPRPSFVLFNAPQPGSAEPLYIGYVELPGGEYLRVEARVVPERDGIRKHFEGTAYDPRPKPTAAQSAQASLLEAIAKYDRGPINDDWPAEMFETLGRI